MKEKYNVLLNSLPREARREILEILDELEDGTKKVIDNVERMKNTQYELLRHIDGIRNNTVVIGDIQKPVSDAIHDSKVLKNALKEMS